MQQKNNRISWAGGFIPPVVMVTLLAGHGCRYLQFRAVRHGTKLEPESGSLSQQQWGFMMFYSWDVVVIEILGRRHSCALHVLSICLFHPPIPSISGDNVPRKHVSLCVSSGENPMWATLQIHSLSMPHRESSIPTIWGTASPLHPHHLLDAFNTSNSDFSSWTPAHESSNGCP